MALVRKVTLVAFALSCIFDYARGPHCGTIPVNILCSDDQYPPGALYGQSVQNVLVTLAETTSQSDDYNFYTQQSKSGSSADECYGHAACNGLISEDECDNCVSCGCGILWDSCPKSFGAQVQFINCRVRFENYPFQE